MHLAWYAWLIGFGLTLAFELPVVVGMLARVEPRLSRRLALAVFANLATHPLVWLFFPLLPVRYSTRTSLAELWAFGAEALFYATFVAGLGPWRALKTSVLANATSFGLGWLVVSQWGRWLF